MIDINDIKEKGDIVRKICALFCNEYYELCLVGSRIRNDHRKESDYDFVMKVSDPLALKNFPRGRIMLNESKISYEPVFHSKEHYYIYNNVKYNLTYYNIDKNEIVIGRDDKIFVSTRNSDRESRYKEK